MFASPTRRRSTAEERREDVLAVASREFAHSGLHGTSTESIAQRAGISHAYLFRLFGTKRELFIACAETCLQRTLETFRAAAKGDTPQERLDSMGGAYVEMLADRELLLAQMQLFAACSDPQIQEVARAGFKAIRDEVRLLSGAGGEDLHRFFAKGMLITIAASIDMPELGSPEAW
ncbi:MAG TPA: TetR/AcrR family transcriptional regulator [Solirubrobacteraceae bacterium]|jgi:AcrR family transcriptional regulator